MSRRRMKDPVYRAEYRARLAEWVAERRAVRPEVPPPPPRQSKPRTCTGEDNIIGPFLVRYEQVRGLRCLTVQYHKTRIHQTRIEITPPQPNTRSGWVQVCRDGFPLSRRVSRLPHKRHLSKPIIKRWVIAAASEFDGVTPRWSTQQISRNLGAQRRVRVCATAIGQLLNRRFPDLAKRRRDGWHEARRKVNIGVVKFRGMDRSQRLAALDAVMAEEVKGRAMGPASKENVLIAIAVAKAAQEDRKFEEVLAELKMGKANPAASEETKEGK